MRGSFSRCARSSSALSRADSTFFLPRKSALFWIASRTVTPTNLVLFRRMQSFLRNYFFVARVQENAEVIDHVIAGDETKKEIGQRALEWRRGVPGGIQVAQSPEPI